MKFRAARGTHVDVISEKASGRDFRGLDEREAQKLPQFFRRLRQQDFGSLVDALHLKQSFIQVLLFETHPSAAQHHLLHALRELRGEAVGDEAAVADPDYAACPNALGLEEGGHALGLEGLGAVGAGGVRVPEEEEVRDVDVEAARELGEEVVPLPHCVGAEAVEEDEVGPGVFVGLGGPAVHDGALAQIRGGGFEAGVGEGEAEAAVARGGEADTPRHGVLVNDWLIDRR